MEALKAKVKKLKDELLIKQDRLDQLMKTLKRDFGIPSIEVARKRAKEVTKELDKLEQKKQILITKVEEKLDEYERKIS